MSTTTETKSASTKRERDEKDVLDAIKASTKTIEVTKKAQIKQVTKARKMSPPVTWESIGKAMGISRQAAQERFG